MARLDDLAGEGRERARALVPAVWAATFAYFLASPLLGIHFTRTGIVLELIVFTCLTTLLVLLRTRRIPPRWALVAGAGLVWCPIAASMIAMYDTGLTAMVTLLIAQAAMIGFLLATWLVIATLLANIVLATTFLVTSNAPNAPIYIAALVSASTFALLLHRNVRTSIARSLEQARSAERAHTETLRLQDQLLHANRMEAVGTLAAGVAHDMNNVLASVRSFAELSLEDAKSVEVQHGLRQILTQSDRGAALTRGLLTFSRRGQYRKQVVRVADVLTHTLTLLARTLPRSIEVVHTITDDQAAIDGDPMHLSQMLINLALNANDAMGGTGKLEIAVDVVADRARFRVQDTGTGIDAATQQRIFEPFFTTKPLGQGTGLGLSTVWGIVAAHEGTIDVASAPGEGATFTIHLPLVHEKRPSAGHSVATSEPIHSVTILVVDDEQPLRDSTCRLLQRMGAQCVAASNGQEAIDAFDARSGDVDLVVLDMGMPIMGGARCFELLRQRNPTVPVLVVTGYAIDEEAQQLVAAGARVLEKPFASRDLRAEVARLLAGRLA